MNDSTPELFAAFEKNRYLIAERIDKYRAPQKKYESKITGTLLRFLYSKTSRCYRKSLIQTKELIPLVSFRDLDEFKQHFSNYSKNESSGSSIKKQFEQCATTIPIYNANVPELPSPNSFQKEVSNVQFLIIYGTILKSSAFFKKVSKYKSLTYLSITHCYLTKLVMTIRRLPLTVRFLDLSNNFIDDIPDDAKWDQLEGLNLSRNAFKKFPQMIRPEKLPNLSYLSLAFNPIEIVATSLMFPGILHLDLSYCSLVTFSEPLRLLKNVKFLHLAGNTNLQNFSFSAISGLTSVRTLDISGIPIVSNSKNDAQMPATLEIIIAKKCEPKKIPEGNYCVLFE